MTMGERLKTVRGGMQREELAGLLGIHKNTLASYELDKSDPGADVLNKLLELRPNINPTWLLVGIGNQTNNEFNEKIKMVTADLRQKFLHEAPIKDNSVRYASESEMDKEYVLVPRYDVRASAGGGALIESEQIVDYLAFKSEWVRNAMHMNPADLVLISATGDSMYPTIRERDLLLVDKSQFEVKDDAIYILRFDGALLAKRLQKLFDGSIQIKSDNNVYDSQLVPSDKVDSLKVLGRVVWVGGRI